MASVRAHGPRPKALSTIRASPTMPPWRANIPAWPLRSARNHLEAPDRGVGRLHRLEPAHGPDQQLELAVVGLDDVVEVFHLPVPRVLWAFPHGLQLRDGSGIGWRLVGVEHLGLSPILQPSQGLAEKSLRCLGVAGRREMLTAEEYSVPIRLTHTPTTCSVSCRTAGKGSRCRNGDSIWQISDCAEVRTWV